MGRFAQIAALFVVLPFVATPLLAQDKRLALVIGNSAYKHTPGVNNPGNEAADVAAKLKQVGFEVIVGRDLDTIAMDRTIRSFAETLAGPMSPVLLCRARPAGPIQAQILPANA
jgi:hypothetical protein